MALVWMNPPSSIYDSKPKIIGKLTLSAVASSSLRIRFQRQAPRTSLCISAMSTRVQETLPPALNSISEPPALFDGTTRLYISYTCPYAQRVWIARNYKGLQDTIKLIPIDLQNRPSWYKEKVYPENKVPSLEHNNKVIGESLDLLKYIETHFEGPELLPADAAKREFAEELLAYTGTLNKTVYSSLPKTEDWKKDIDPAFDFVESALSKFDDGPFFLGQFSLVDIAYAPFIERYHLVFSNIKNSDITEGRPKLALWIEELNKIDEYRQTKQNPEDLLHIFLTRFGAK